MPAKKTRRLDLQRDFGELLEANRKAHEWAERAVALRNAGKAKQADLAEQKCKVWLARGMRIRDLYDVPPPHLRKP